MKAPLKNINLNIRQTNERLDNVEQDKKEVKKEAENE
jgi:hypothetical protein